MVPCSAKPLEDGRPMTTASSRVCTAFTPVGHCPEDLED